MLKGDIEVLLKEHTNGVNSFVDNDGKNHWYDLIDDIFNLANKELQAVKKGSTDQSELKQRKTSHTHYQDGKAVEYAGTARECKDVYCLVKTHQHIEEGSNKIVNKDGSVNDCTDYCKSKNGYVLDAHNKEWVEDEKAEAEINALPKPSNAWSRDCVFTADMMRTVHSRLTGKVLTLVDASVVDTRQNKALKDLIHNAIWQETWRPITDWVYEQEHKKGKMFPFYHEPEGLNG